VNAGDVIYAYVNIKSGLVSSVNKAAVMSNSLLSSGYHC
jgi:hypothetical protein